MSLCRFPKFALAKVAKLAKFLILFLSDLFLFCLACALFSTCSFFASKGNNPPFHLVSFLSFSLPACVFFIHLVSFFLRHFLKKDTTPVSFALFRAHFIYFWYFCSFLTLLLGPFLFRFWVIGFCPYYILILSYFYAGYYLFRIFTCSLFALLVPFRTKLV